jgi:preprotein translocase subunit YajC
LLTIFGIAMAMAPSQGGNQGGGGAFGMFLPLILMFVIFYFLLIRPNQKREKNRLKMINDLQKGDKVLTSGGIFGLVVAVKPEENKVVLKIADNTKVEFAKSAVSTKLDK